MGRKGFASQLPAKLRQEIDQMIVEGRATVDDVWAFVQSKGLDVGRSSVHRHMQSVEEVAADMRRAREAAAAIVQKLGPDAAEGTLGALLIEIVQNIAFKIAMEHTRNPEGPGLTMEDLMFLTSAVQKLISAEKTNTDRVLKIRQEIAKKAADEAVNTAKSKGVSAETVEAIRNAVLGVAS